MNYVEALNTLIYTLYLLISIQNGLPVQVILEPFIFSQHYSSSKNNKINKYKRIRRIKIKKRRLMGKINNQSN